MTLKILSSHLGSNDVMLLLTNGADVTVMLEMGNDKNASLMAILWRSQFPYSPSYHGNHKLVYTIIHVCWVMFDPWLLYTTVNGCLMDTVEVTVSILLQCMFCTYATCCLLLGLR